MSDPAPRPDAGPAARPGLARRGLRALAAGFVPTVLASHGGGLVWSGRGIPDHGLALASAVFAGIFLAVWFARRAIRSTPLGRAGWRIALLAWVAFATWRSYARWPDRPAGPVSAATITRWPAARQRFLAGTGEASFRLTGTDPIAGYGARPRRVALPWPVPGPLLLVSRDLMAGDDAAAPRIRAFVDGEPTEEFVGARAVVVRTRAGEAPLAICRLDLVMCDPAIFVAVLERVKRLGFTRDTLVLCATHTHSGPGGFSGICLAELIATDLFRRDVFDRVVGAAVAAVEAAFESAVPARIGFVRAKDEGAQGRPILAENRSAADPDFVDREILGIRLDAAEGDRRIALVLNAAVHPVWGRPKDRAFSGDLAGALEREPSIGDGARVVFVNGAEGDVKPRLARAGVGAFAAAVSSSLGARARSETLAITAATVTRDLGAARYLHLLLGDREKALDAASAPLGVGPVGALGGALVVPVTALLASVGAPDLKIAFDPRGGLGALVALDREMASTVHPFGAIRLETDEGVALLAVVPAELNTAVGLGVKASGRRRGASPTMVLGLANAYAAYVATRGECVVNSYESRMTLFGPGTAQAVREAIDAAFDAVGAPDPTAGH